jgi:hypothetical protein
MARPTKPEKENPFKGIEGGFVMKPKAALLLRKEGKLSGDLEYYLLDYMLGETVSAEGKPERLTGKKATAAFIAEFLGFSVKCTEEALADGAERGLWGRKKVRGAWQYWVTWQNWAKVPKYEANKSAPAEVAETVAEAPKLHDATRFVVKAGPFRHPITLAQAVSEVVFGGEMPHGLRCEYGFQAETLFLNVFGSEEKAQPTPPPRGVARVKFTEPKAVRVSVGTKTPKTDTTTLDDLEAWAQRVPAEHIHVLVPAKVLHAIRALNVPLDALKRRFYLRRKKYDTHGMLLLLAQDVASQAKAGAAWTAADDAEVERLEALYMKEQMERNARERAERERAEKTHGAGGGS